MHPVNEGRYHPILRGLRRNAGVHVKTEVLRGRLEVVPARSHKPITEVRFLPTATKIRKSGRAVYACSLENCRTETFREFESHLFRHNLGSVQQTKTLTICKVLADKTILSNLGCVMGLRVILARSLSMGSIPIRSTNTTENL